MTLHALQIFLLGAPRLERDGEVISLRRRKAVALLAYLAMSGRPHSRDALATLLWPDHNQSSAQANLRRDLSLLKQTLGEEVMVIDRRQVSLDPQADLWLDTAAFQSRLAEAQEHKHDSLTEAVDLYAGNFMEGFTLSDSPAFDEWQFFQSEVVAVELAWHFEQAGLASKAAEYLYQAGSRAVRLPANEEAIAHFERGLSLLETLPETTERNRLELAIQIALFAPLAGAKGYGAPEVGQAYTRARELCEKIDDPDQLFLVLYGLWGHNLVRSELQTSRQLAAECLSLAERVGKVAFLMEAHRMTDESAFYMGLFDRSYHHLEKSLALYDPQEHRSHAETYGQDPGVALLSHGCCILWHVGLPEQALRRGQEAVALAQEQEHPFSLGFALCYSAMMHQYRREPDAVLELAEAAIELSQEQGFILWLAQASYLQGWALAEQGQAAEGSSQMIQSLADWRATGSEFLAAYNTAQLATVQAKMGQVGEGLALLEDAFAVAAEKSQGLYEAELYRLKGEFLLQQGAIASEVEPYFHQAIEVAQRRHALSQELRAVTSLSRLWHEQGKSAAAYTALSKIYDRFGEGFDTADLQESQELLQLLASKST